MQEEKRRYVGIDLGKREYTMAIIETAGDSCYFWTSPGLMDSRLSRIVRC